MQDEIKFPSTKEEVIAVCEMYKIKNYTINPDMSINVNGKVSLSHKKLHYLPVRFTYVKGNMALSGNRLISLEGSPEKVGGDFNCCHNKLMSLEGGPKEIGVSFSCRGNKLITLEGGPLKVGKSYQCGKNRLETLKGICKIIPYWLDISDNKLKSSTPLEDANCVVEGHMKSIATTADECDAWGNPYISTY